jgi:hypothetical protein
MEHAIVDLQVNVHVIRIVRAVLLRIRNIQQVRYLEMLRRILLDVPTRYLFLEEVLLEFPLDQ